MRKRRKRNFIAPVEDEIVLDTGQITYSGAKPPVQCEYTLSCLFPEHKIKMTIGEGEDKVSLVESGPSTIVDKLQNMKYGIPKYLALWIGRSVSATKAMNTTIIQRRKDEGTPIPVALQFRTDIWMFCATNEEIESITKLKFVGCGDTMIDVTIRLFQNYRYHAIDAVASLRANAALGTMLTPEETTILKMVGDNNDAETTTDECRSETTGH